MGETTKDGMFTLNSVECLGACVNAPMFQVNDNYFVSVTVNCIVNVAQKLKPLDNIFSKHLK